MHTLHRLYFWMAGPIALLLAWHVVAAEEEKEQDAAADSGVEEIVLVTGSAIPRRESTTSAPMSVIDRPALEVSGLVSVGDILQDLPAQSNAINLEYNNGGDGSTRVSLRSLGARHTLVLLDGHRLVPSGTGADASVDLNVIPLALVSRIEVLKDGASAVYGSDAVGGAVNIITRNDLRGLQADVYYGVSGEGDGANHELSVVYGAGGDRGNVFVGASFTRLDEVMAGDRSFSASDFDFDYQTRERFATGSTATPNGWLLRDEFEESFDPGNAFWQSDVAAGCPFPPEPPGDRSVICTRDGPGPWREFVDPDDLYNFQPENFLLTPSERTSAFGSAQFELGATARLFAQVLYTKRESQQRLASEPFFTDLLGVPISAASIYNPYGKDVFFYRRRLLEAGPRVFDQEVDTLQAIVGFDGAVPGDFPRAHDWTWELSFNFGESSADQVNTGGLVFSRVIDAIGPSFIDENGAPRCGVQGPLPGPGDDATIAGCVPVDLLGTAGSITPQMMNYLAHRGTSTGSNKDKSLLARLAGQLLETPWRGYLSTAIGAEYRERSGDFVPDAITQSGDTTGNTLTPLRGSYDATEEFAELSFVPVTGEPWARSLEFDVAARAYQYSSTVEGVAWRGGALWKTAGGISLRGSYSHDYSAPTIPELFNPGAAGFGGGQDPCDAVFGSLDDPNVAARCAAEGLPPTFESQFLFFVPTLFGTGNPALLEETSTTRTLGVVLEPPWFDGFALSVDYFDVVVEDESSFLSSFEVLDNCYFRPDGQRQNCDDVVRDPATGFINFVNLKQLNLSETSTSGFDIALSYTHDFGGAGRFTFTTEAVYLDDYEHNENGFVIKGVGVYDLELVLPRLRTQSTLRWDRGPLGLGANLRTNSDFLECEFNFCTDPDLRAAAHEVSSYYVTDVFGSYQLETSLGTTTFRLGVNNVFDEPPAVIYNGFYATSDPEYDFVGRFFYAGLSQTF